ITREAPGRALMLGDGLNDSLAFDAAHVRGTPVVDRGLLEPKADFFFLDRGLTGIQTLLRTAQRYRTTVRQMFTFAAAYNIATVTLCLAGMMNPLLAAILMPASSLMTIGMAAAGMRR
ncbi:MAG: ATPase P, partial [Opitutales bacterium]